MRRILALCLLAAVARADRIVIRSGAVLTGKATVERDLVRAGRKKIEKATVYLVERDDGTLVYAPDLHARLRGYEYIANQHMRGEYTKLVRECCQVGDFLQARLLLEKAERAGLSSREAVKLKLRLEKAQRKRGYRGQIKSQRLAKRAAKVDGYYADVILARARTALDTRDPDGLRLLRTAIRNGMGEDLLAKHAPRKFAIGGPKVWLDWHLDLESSGATIVADEQDAAALAAARRDWRPDVNGVHADPILLITPLKDSFLIGRCLAYTRLSCSALAELFQTDTPVRTPAEPMTVFLFEDKDEYMTTSGTGRTVENSEFLAWTAGHYSPAEGISRFYWFRDADAERRIVGTCVHELTHHWLSERNPRARPAPGRGANPGFWIVEGFAEFMSEGVYDVETGTWSLFNPRARTLDVMQSAGKSRAIIPWSAYYRMSQAHFGTLNVNNQNTVVLRWSLRPTIVSTSRMFYEQAGATCHFLFHADGGKYRQKMLQYVDNWYSGSQKDLSIQAAFGMSGQELGKRVVAFAEAVAKGWRPPR